jgi:TRAP-type C4-dicarboxylate transport system substrate-binding protein
MNRYHRFGVSVLAALLGVGIASTAYAQSKVDGPKVHWNFSVWGNKRGNTLGVEELSRLLSEATNGNFVIQIHYGEALAAARENLDGIAIGAFETALVGPAFTPGRLLAAEGLGLPFLPLPNLHVIRLVQEEYWKHPDTKHELARANALCLLTVPLPANEFIGKGKVPATLADWKGMRVRALGGDAQAMKNLGAVPANLPPPDLYGSLDRGLLDAVSLPYYAIASFKLHEVTRWYTTNMALSIGASLMAGNIKAYESLPPQYKKLLADLHKPSLDYYEKANDEAAHAAVELFRARNLAPVTYSSVDRENLGAIARPIWDEWVDSVTKKGYKGQELLQLMLDTARKAST